MIWLIWVIVFAAISVVRFIIIIFFIHTVTIVAVVIWISHPFSYSVFTFNKSAVIVVFFKQVWPLRPLRQIAYFDANINFGLDSFVRVIHVKFIPQISALSSKVVFIRTLLLVERQQHTVMNPSSFRNCFVIYAFPTVRCTI